MSDIFEVTVIEQPLQIEFTDELLSVQIIEDNFDITVNNIETAVEIKSEDIEILTIAEQGPPGGDFPIHIGNTPPSDISLFWLDTN